MLLRHLASLLGVVSVLGVELKLGRTTLTGRDIPVSGVEFFGGIPFAETPVGKLRFRAPVLKTRLNAARFNATDYGKSCLQPPITVSLADISEDCLTINIHRPAGTKPGSQLPVLFWAYGGAFIVGDGKLYNGSEIVAHSIRRGTPIIYANFNYRLGPFGYPQGREARDNRELNLALKDTITALEWLHANIDVFGGDKRKITIFGESAGSINIGTLYLNKDFERLVRGAILESGLSNSLGVYAATDREDPWQSFVRAIPSCVHFATSGNTLPCLRNASETEISAGYLQFLDAGLGTTFAWTPVLDEGRGTLFPDFPSRLYKAGKFARIPFIAGTNLDEGTSFTDARNPNYTEADLKASIILMSSPPLVAQARLEKATDRLVELYPDVPALGSPYRTGDELFGLPSVYKRASALLGDFTFDAARRQWMEAAATHGVKSYGYLFSQPQPGDDPALGVSHGTEISFVYGSPPDPSPSARNLSLIMMDYWISFTVSQDPNDKKGTKRLTWPQYTTANKVLIQLEGNNVTTIKDNFRKEQMAFFDSNSFTFRR